MMFLSATEAVVDDMWAKVMKLYASGKLTGVSDIVRIYPEAGESDVFMFYCKGDKGELKSYAKNLLRHVSYYPPRGFMYYKTGPQVAEHFFTPSRSEGRSYKYRIRCPPLD